MSIPVSTVPSVISYLLTQVTSACASDPLEILVKTGEPAKNLPSDVIQFGSVRRTVRWESFVGGGGNDALYEIYDLELDIYTALAYGDISDDSAIALQVIQRAWQLLGYVETVVRTDPSLGGLVDIAYPQSSVSPNPEWTDGAVGLRVSINAPIHVEATI